MGFVVCCQAAQAACFALAQHGLDEPNCLQNGSRAMQPQLLAHPHLLFPKTLFLGNFLQGSREGKGSGAWSALQAQPGMSVRHRKIRGRGRQGLMLVRWFVRSLCSLSLIACNRSAKKYLPTRGPDRGTVPSVTQGTAAAALQSTTQSLVQTVTAVDGLTGWLVHPSYSHRHLHPVRPQARQRGQLAWG